MIQQSKAVGELPLFINSSVCFAIRDTLGVGRVQYNVKDVLSLKSLTTAERIRIRYVEPIVKRSLIGSQETEKRFLISIEGVRV